jgi:hypothetical protein
LKKTFHVGVLKDSERGWKMRPGTILQSVASGTV